MELKQIKEYLFNAPLKLLSLNDKTLKHLGDLYLPYSVGFEIECSMSENYKLQSFKDIPNIIEVNGSHKEQIYRIPSGINGIICLYLISEQLKFNSLLNESSGIHYHIDMTDCFHLIRENFIKVNSNFILTELDKWKYKGTYNRRNCTLDSKGNWVNFRKYFKTCEIRIGEMTFNYDVLVKRIFHSCYIVKQLKDQLVFEEQEQDEEELITLEKVKNYQLLYNANNQKLQTLIRQIDKIEQEEKDLEIVKPDTIENKSEVVSNRIVKL